MTSTKNREPVLVPLGQLLTALAVLAFPYLVVGLVWADRHTGHLQYTHGLDFTFSYIGEVIAWPVLIFADVTLQ